MYSIHWYLKLKTVVSCQMQLLIATPFGSTLSYDFQVWVLISQYRDVPGVPARVRNQTCDARNSKKKDVESAYRPFLRPQVSVIKHSKPLLLKT
jgi:hypothetical protein